MCLLQGPCGQAGTGAQADGGGGQGQGGSLPPRHCGGGGVGGLGGLARGEGTQQSPWLAAA
eukprot:2576531-Pyramimonas_sp.AAC.1